MNLKVTQVFLHDIRHGHAQPGGKVLCGHGSLLFWIFQQLCQTICEALNIAGRIKLNRQLLTLGHLSKVGQIGTDNRNPIGTGEMSNTAGPGRR
jgi:hypothetical protein